MKSSYLELVNKLVTLALILAYSVTFYKFPHGQIMHLLNKEEVDFILIKLTRFKIVPFKRYISNNPLKNNLKYQLLLILERFNPLNKNFRIRNEACLLRHLIDLNRVYKLSWEQMIVVRTLKIKPLKKEYHMKVLRLNK